MGRFYIKQTLTNIINHLNLERMKKTLLFISALVMGAASSFAQDIPNGNFEQTTYATTGIAETWGILTIDFNGTPIAMNPTRDTSYVSGGYDSCIVLTSTTSPVVLVSSSASSPGSAVATVTGSVVSTPRLPIGAFAISETPKALQLAYEYKSAAGDSATVGIELLDAAGLVGGKQYTITDTSSGWKYVNIPFDMLPGKTSADSARITIVSSGTQTTAGTVLKVDALRFLSCVPDTAVSVTPNTAPKLSPASPTAAIANGGTYSQVFTTSLPSPALLESALLPAPAPIERLDSAKVNDVTFAGVTGLTLSCGHPSCMAYGNSTMCFTVSGTPSVTDKEIKGYINVTSYGYSSGLATAIGNPAASSLSLLGSLPLDSITLTVGTPVVGIEDYLDEDIFSVTQNSPNPFTETTTITFNSPNGGNVTFTVIDVLGQIVTRSVIQSASGTNTYTFEAGETEPGTYFFSLSDGENLITKKFVIGD